MSKLVKVFIYNQIGVNEIVSADAVGVNGMPEREWEKIDIESDIIKQYAVYDDVLRVKVEEGFNEDMLLDEVERIDEEVFGF